MMISRNSLIVAGAIVSLVLGTNSREASAGPRIVIRQGGGCGGQGQFLNGVNNILSNPLVGNVVGTIVKHEFGDTSSSAGFPPASKLPTQNQDIENVIARLNKLNGTTTPAPNGNGTAKTPPGGKIPPVPVGADFPAIYPQP